MKKTTWLFLALCFALVLPAFCANSFFIATRSGTVFKITIDSNPTTGYSWRLGAKPDARLVKPAGSRFIAPQTKLVGAGGKEVWTFRALKPGKTKLSLEYARPWEKNMKPAEIRVYEVVIK